MSLLFHVFALITATAYSLAAIVYLSQLSRERQPSSVNARAVLCVGVFSHFCFIVSDILLVQISQQPLNLLDFPHLLSNLSLLLSLSFLVVAKRLGIESLGAFLTPISAALMICSGILFHFGHEASTSTELGFVLTTHIVLVVVATVLFFFSFAVSAAIILQETLIKRKRLFSIQQKLPSLHRLDELNDRLVGLGFWLMALGMGVGVAFAVLKSVPKFWFDPMALWTELTVLVYGSVLFTRSYRGWRGRRVAWLSVAGFCTIVAALVTVGIVSGSAHGY